MVPVESVVFVSLLLDLFAFTIPLPLFPRIIEWYTVREVSNSTGFLSRTLQFVSFVRGLLYKPDQHSGRWDVVLLGGIMGSVFSTLQFLVSPHIGALSDKHGRKRILLITMVGNIVSALLWIQSTSFASYFLSRVIGGLSEGNVQLAIAIISDVTTPANRSKALSLVGIAFAICFIIGPPIGAYFASQPVPVSVQAWGQELNIYAVPAILTLFLLVVETAFLAIFLPETREQGRRFMLPAKNNTTEQNDPGGNGHEAQLARKASINKRINVLNALRRLHFQFLCLFSGVEFTLTFLTFDLFDWDNKKIGLLIGSIGIISALLQGGYVRRATAEVGEGIMAQRGIASCAVGLILLAFVPHFVLSNKTFAIRLLQGAAVCMAFTSATVVNSLTAFASLQCEEKVDMDTGKPIEGHPQLAKGRALGNFRSSGQLGRAVGPLLACASYWTFGPSITYCASAVAMLTLAASMNVMALTQVSP